MKKRMASVALVLCALFSVFVGCGEDLEEENEALKARVNELETDVYELSEVLRLTRETNAEVKEELAQLRGQGNGRSLAFWSTVSRVIDGDTIELDTGEKVRYIGIDTPETLHPSEPVEYYGREASEFNKKLVEGKWVRLEFDVQRKDIYGRTLAYVYLSDGTFVNAELLKQGYAKVSTYPPNVEHVEEFLELEREARENARGLWRKPLELPPPGNQDDDDTIVFITNEGECYHRGWCGSLWKSKIAIKKGEAIRQGYRQCQRCKP